MLPFTIQLEPGLPVSGQMVLAVRRAILSGQMRDGQEFPSVRLLAQELRISPTTAHKVVLALKDEELLAAKPGIGMVVSAGTLPSRESRQGALREACSVLLAEARAQHLSLGDTVEALRGRCSNRGLDRLADGSRGFFFRRAARRVRWAGYSVPDHGRSW